MNTLTKHDLYKRFKSSKLLYCLFTFFWIAVCSIGLNTVIATANDNPPQKPKTLEDLGVDPSEVSDPKVKIVALKPPPLRKAGRIIEGETAEEKAAALVKALHEEAKVI